jgi:hypothetical protein
MSIDLWATLQPHIARPAAPRHFVPRILILHKPGPLPTRDGTDGSMKLMYSPMVQYGLA